MRARVILLVLAILLVAGFASLNWPEFTRPTPLSFGVLITEAPLGVVMLTLLGIALLWLLVSSAVDRTTHLVESRRYHKTLEAQRELADKAEASRFTELRTHFDTHLRELKQRDAITSTEFEKNMLNSNRELRTHLEQFQRAVLARMSELESRLDGSRVAAPRAYDAPAVTTVATTPVAAGTALPDNNLARREAIRAEREAEQRQEEHLLAEHRQREERLRAERAAEQPPLRGRL
jgi:hypothetical protein